MPEEPQTRMLVLVDSTEGAQAPLSIGHRYAAVTEELTPSTTDAFGAPMATEGPSRPTVGPVIDELLRTAAEREIPWIGIRRDIAPPHELLRELLLATGRHSNLAVPGFAVFLAEGEVPPISRILAIVDRRHGAISGLLAHTAVTMAIAAGAELDVLVIAAHGEDLNVEDELDTLAVNRERQMYDDAVATAAQHRLRVRWLTAAGVGDTWTLVNNQMTQQHYDLIIDDLGDLSLGWSMRRGRALDQALSPGEIGEIPLRLLSEYFNPVLLVIDGIQLGMAPAPLLRAGAVAALAVGVVSSGLAPGLTATVSATTAPSGADPVQNLMARLSGALESKADTRRSRAAGGSSRSADREREVTEGADAEAAEAAETRKSPKAPKGGADPGDVAEARDDVKASKKKLDKAKAKLAKAKDELAKATEGDEEARADAQSALAELEAARTALSEYRSQAGILREDASGLSGLVPGGASAEEAALAESRAELAQYRLDRAVALGAQALDTLQAAEDAVAQAEDELAEAEQKAAELKADYAYEKKTLKVYQASLKDSRQSPVAKGSYRFTARFGQAGGYWSSGHHTGLDFAGSIGTNIRAAASGKVVSAGYEGAYGNRVVIDHGGGLQTTYNHMSAIRVSVGQKVYAGDHIGELGSTGNSTGPHLHFEVLKNDQFIDPEAWLGL